MPRRSRFAVDDGIYHVLSRGNNRQYIFKEDADFIEIKKLIRDYKQKYQLAVYHYSLMSSHIHMIIKSPDGESLSKAMKGIKLRYTQYYDEKYESIGHLWQERFKNFLIQTGRYLLECGRYVELNAVRAGIVERPEAYRWSSYRAYACGEIDEIVNKSPEYLGMSDCDEERHKLYCEYVTAGINERRSEERYFKEGVYGTEEFAEKMRKKGLLPLWSHRGRPKKKKGPVPFLFSLL